MEGKTLQDMRRSHSVSCRLGTYSICLQGLQIGQQALKARAAFAGFQIR